jgi:Protein of unknown function (DUF3501)
MRPVKREELLDYQTWSDRRTAEMPAIMEIKRRRRVHLGRELTFLFENPATVRYQVQEMMRVEHMARESDIQHELTTYNELLGGPGELGCSLLIEIDDVERRAVLLRAWKDLPAHLYVKLPDGRKVYATFDERQIGDDRLSSVQFLKFMTEGQPPVAVGSDLPAHQVEEPLSEEQRAALAEDLRG